MSDAMSNELKMEAVSTRCLLERVPEDSLEWAPHAKSMTLGQLSLHLAQIPGTMCQVAQLKEFDLASLPPGYAQPASKQEILDAFAQSLESAEAYLTSLTPESLETIWRLTMGGKEMMAVPRAAMLRVFLLNHLYHHRGQLSVYLRMLDVPVPIIYAKSADELPVV